MVQTLASGVNLGFTDIVIANFHVFSYFTDEEAALFSDVCRIYLKSGGLVAFDFWDLEAVIAQPPTESVKRAQFLNRELMRKCKPKVTNNLREVTINFEFYSRSELLFKETHIIFPRYLDEVMSFFQADFEFCGSFDLSTGESYTQQSYGNLVF